ncbi:MAG: ABC transporter ATP-binding protein [Eubacteriales bacterium]|nr:ABC transporter ATP-binding protein [Eubacteriales bacterium]
MNYRGTFSSENIEKAISNVYNFADQVTPERQTCIRVKLIMDELLLTCRDAMGETAAFTITLTYRQGDIRIILETEGDEFDPMQNASPLLLRLLQDTAVESVWSRSKGINTTKLVVPVCNTLKKNLKLSWKYTEGQRGTFVLAVLSQLVGIGLKIAIPVLSAQVIVNLEAGIFEELLLLAAVLFVVLVVTDLAAFISNRSYNKVYNRTLSNLEKDLVNGILKITNGCVDEKGAGLFIQRLTVDTNTLAIGLDTLADLTSQIFNYLGILAAILLVCPPIFMIVLALLTIQSFIEIKRANKMKKDDRIYREANESFTGFVAEMVNGSRDVKLLHNEDNFRSELENRIDDANNKRMYMQNRGWKYRMARLEIGEAGYFMFIVILALLTKAEQIDSAQAIILFTYYTQLGSPAVLLLGQFLEFIKGFNLSAERVYALLENTEFPKESFGTRHLDEIKGAFRFENVSFAYKNANPLVRPHMVLKQLNMEIPAGQMTAIVGRSGSGKTTVFNLMSMLYKASSGVVFLDGENIRELDRETIRSNIAVVSQNPYIFHLSIRDNLKIVKPDMTEEEMHRACRMACIDEEICNMEEGYDTLIGEGGANLSGGQRQRLAIARNFLRDFRVLLMDEATSALDNITQSKIQETLSNLRKTHTIIIIAHRLSTILDADKIIYLDDGKVLDEGTHQEMMQRCAPYRELYSSEIHAMEMSDHI